MDVLQHALPWEIESLRKSITNMNALIQTQARRICALEAENRDLQTRLTNRRRHRHTATQTNRSTQTRDNTESDTRSAVVFVSRKRKSRSELCSMGLKRRKEEEETAFKNVATLFGEQVENEIKRVGVTVEYGDGVEHEFLAWRKNRPEGDTFDDSKEDGPETDDIQRTEQEEDEAMARTLSVLKLKIRHSISYSLLHELRMEGFPVPPQAKIREQSERLGRCIEILQPSVNCSRRRLVDTIEFVLGQKKHAHLLQQDGDITITLRFSSDGAKLSKNKDSVRGVFKVVPPRPDHNNPAVSMLPEDEHTLFLYMGTEDRKSLDIHAVHTLREMEEAAKNGVEVSGRHINIQWILCADWKAMALLKGVNAANADYFCLWCKCSKKQIRDFEIPSWPISRTSKEHERLLATADSLSAKKGYSKTDLLPFIPYQRVVPDELHLRIRITNKLLNQVVRWSIELKTTAELMAEMKRIHVDFKVFEEIGDDDRGKVRKWTQPSGDALNKILHQLDLVKVLGEDPALHHCNGLKNLTKPELLQELVARKIPVQGLKTKEDLLKCLRDALQPGEQISGKRSAVSYSFELDEEGAEHHFVSSDGHPEEDVLDVRELQELWHHFAQLMKALRAVPGTEHHMSPDEFQKAARDWATMLHRVTFDDDVIPYIHCLVYHIPQALESFRFLPDIGASQVERKNYDQRCAYFTSTSRGGGAYNKTVTQQILEKENISLFFDNFSLPKERHESGRAKRRLPKKLLPLGGTQ